MSQRVAAGIVVFKPDAGLLQTLIETVAAEVERIFVFLNSALEPDLRDVLSRNECIRIIEADSNLGVGVALNLIALEATFAEFDSVILFDQDSQPQAGMIGCLLDLQTALLDRGHRPAVVAPLIVSTDATLSKPPTYRYRSKTNLDARAKAVDFVPTSGSLIRLDVWRDIGAFRSDYFIDGIDLEWSFRAWSRGFSCWIAPHCPMTHSIGSGVISWPLFRFRMPDQRPFRMYCLIRNTLYGLRLAHIPAQWKLKQLLYLPVQMLSYWVRHRFDGSVLRILAAGLCAGLLGQLGIPRDAPTGRL